MNKKVYQTPCVVAVTIAAHQLVCTSTVTTTIVGGGQTPPGGWGAGQAPRRRSDSVWDE